MKQYTKTLPDTTSTSHNDSSLTSSRVGKAAKRGSAGGLPFGTLTNTHILTSEWTSAHDRFLDICIEEWKNWVHTYELAKLSRPEKPPFTLTDFTSPTDD